MAKIEGNGFTLVTPEKIGRIEVKKISKFVTNDTAVLTIVPSDEFFKRAFGHNPGPKKRIQFNIVCSRDCADSITKAIGIPLTEEPEIVPSSRSGMDE